MCYNVVPPTLTSKVESSRRCSTAIWVPIFIRLVRLRSAGSVEEHKQDKRDFPVLWVTFTLVLHFYTMTVIEAVFHWQRRLCDG